jgi:pectinesterase inhibitor-like protein
MMASFGVFVLIFIFTLSYQPSTLVRTDDNLIKSLCSKADFPSICLDCLTSNPSSKTADAPELSIIAISCAQKEANLLYEVLSNQYESAPKSPLKTILGDCAERTLDARNDFGSVLQSVSARNYGGAKGIVINLIQPLVDSCTAHFSDLPNIPIPAAVAAGIQQVTFNCKNVVAILSNI